MLKTLKPYFALIRPYAKQFNIAVASGIVAGVGSGGAVALGAEKLFKILMEESVVLGRYEMLSIALLFPAIFAIIGAALFVNAYFVNFCAIKIVEGLRLQLFRLYQDIQLAFFQKNKTGDLISRIMTDCQALQLTLSSASKNIVTQPAQCVSALGALGVLAYRNPGVLPVLASILIVPVVVFPIRYFSSKIQKKAFKQQEKIGNLTSEVSQNISGAKEVRAFNLQDSETRRFSDRVQDLFKAQMKVIKYTASLSPSIELLTSFGLSIAFIIGKQNNVGPEQFIAIFLALYMFYASLKKIGALSGELNQGLASYQRIQGTLDQQIDILDPSEPQQIGRLQGAISFENVSFAYAEETNLSDVNVRLEPGEVCALVGPSGAGKSTFAHLIPRFYDVAAGKVCIDGHDVRQLRQRDLRDNIAIVSQDPILFDLSILENIRLGRPDASDEAVQQAARQAFAHEFISAFPQGYQTIVGERGARLSGGQKQRIAIARAFLRKAPILILDEATSALDSESEKMIQRALEELVVGKTVLMIAHRFSTIKNATKILVFDNGRIVATGPHATLYAENALYRTLYDQQQRSLD